MTTQATVIVGLGQTGLSVARYLVQLRLSSDTTSDR